jgi:hypothetical protein
MLINAFGSKSGIPHLIRAALWLLCAATVNAQSIDLNSPTPVVTNEIAGRIAPLDIGDARLTKYFYTFNSVQGDLELTIESSNLDGDIDIYTAGNLRPLTRVTLYAGASSSRVAKTVYIRRGEPLILRVQARTPNDTEGSFRITLGGAFSPAVVWRAMMRRPSKSPERVLLRQHLHREARTGKLNASLQSVRASKNPPPNLPKQKPKRVSLRRLSRPAPQKNLR